LRLRTYREGDRAALARLGVMAFGEGLDRWERYYAPGENPRLDPEQVRVIEEDGEVRATATVLPLEVFVDGAPVPMGGVAAVNSHPAYRRRGYAGRLMRAILEEMRERGFPLSMLTPFAHAFYRAYGWEIAAEQVQYALKPQELPTSPEQRFVRAYREEDLPRVRELLDEEAAEHPLSVRRSDRYWEDVLRRDDLEAAVYERDGRVEGYLLYRLSDWEERDPPRTLTLSELIARTPAAWEALVSFGGAYDPLAYGVRYNTSPGRPLHPYLESSFVDAKLSPDQMLRLVDVEAALNRLDRSVGEAFVLEVSDEVLPENAGEYTLGGGEVVRGAETSERVALDVRQLAQLYAGYLPVPELSRRGLLKTGSPRALELLDAYFPPRDPWLFPLDRF
jgi:predicted acetyltransferase